MWLSVLYYLFIGVASTTVTTENRGRKGFGTGPSEAELGLNLADLEFTASSRLDVFCTENSVILDLTVTDTADEVERSSIDVGSSGEDSCRVEGEDQVSLVLGFNPCGRITSVEETKIVYSWDVRISYYPASVGSVSFQPLWSIYPVRCEVPIVLPSTPPPTIAPTSITDISLQNSGIDATSRLETKCTENSLSLSLTVNDPDSELERSGILVGEWSPGCSVESTNPLVLLDLGVNACNRIQTVETTRVMYRWKVTVRHYPAAVAGIQFQPLTFTHEAYCEVPVHSVDPSTGNEQPGDEIGNTAGQTSAGFKIKLTKDPSSTTKLWQFILSPEVPLASGISYKLTTCTAKPTDQTEPVLNLIDRGCAIRKTGTQAAYSPSNNEYRLTVRAFGFAGMDETIDIQCAVELCVPLESGFCVGQGPTLPGCEAISDGDRQDRETRAGHPIRSRRPRPVRSPKQYILSNVVVM